MKYLVDTHLLLWASVGQKSSRKSRSGLTAEAITVIEDLDNTLFFSAAAIWEVCIKSALGKPDFNVDANVLRRALLDNGYVEVPITSEHAAAVGGLAGHHADPFDRIQIAQATVEGITLLTDDSKIGEYTNHPVRVV
jgi:PIN domain nuclease of toxin-antitoxin system